MTRKGFRYIITAVAAVAFSTSGCHEFLPEPETRCSDNRSLTEKLLPEFIGQGYRRTVNPCFEFLDIARLVLGLVPERSRRKAGNFELFRAKLIHIVDRLGDVKDIIECGYQRDRLAIGIYQSLTTDWSVGVVIAIRGSTDAFLNVSACFVGKLIRDLICAECASAPSAGPLCADLAEKLPSAEKGLIRGEVLAAPSLNIRKGPAVSC